MSWLKILAQKGHRLTAQRRRIVTAVEGEAGDISPEAVYTHLKGQVPSLDRTTVYRTFRLLEQTGLLHHTHRSDGARVYRRDPAGSTPRLLCTRCGKLSPVGEEVAARVAALLLAHTGFEADLGHYAIAGRCAGCQGRPHQA